MIGRKTPSYLLSRFQCLLQGGNTFFSLPCCCTKGCLPWLLSLVLAQTSDTTLQYLCTDWWRLGSFADRYEFLVLSLPSYHWRELPQVLFLSRQNTSFVSTNICLSFCRDKHVCCNKTFVAANIILSRQKFCHDKLTFVATIKCLSPQNTSFVTTQLCFDLGEK